MAKEKLIVKNFFTLKDVEIELGKFNVFIGEQASGKSLIIKLISFLNKMLILGISMESDQYEQKFTQQFYTLFRIDYSMLHKDFQVNYQFSDFTILSVKNDGKKLQVNLTAGTGNYLSRNFHIQVFFPAGRTFIVDLHRNIFKLLNPLDSNNGQQITIDPLLFEFGEHYQDAIEAFNQSKGYMPPSSESMISKLDNHINWFDNKFINILKGKYIYDPIGGFISQNTGNVRPWHSSSGQQETLPIYLILHKYLHIYNRLSFDTSGLYIEEPEAHLYPTAQKDIIEMLVYITNATNIGGLYITTHSPYILTVLNNLIMAIEVKDKQPDFEPNLLVPFEDVRAYFIADGKAHSLMNEEYRIIDAEKLDEVSNTISREYSEMVDML